MNKIYVNFNDLTFGELSFDDNLYKFQVYPEALKQAKTFGYPLDLYKLDKNFESYKLPTALSDFIPPSSRELYNLAGLNEADSKFEKLYKIASLPLMLQGLSISLQKIKTTS